MFFFDTETCGFHGPIVLIQYANDGENVQLHHVWHETINDTIQLIEYAASQTVCGFNLAYDWFHFAQQYTTLIELGNRVGYQEYPIDHIDSYANCESVARNGKCVKPAGALDILLYARRGPYQSTMDRRNIVLKKVPIVLADRLCDELEQRVELKDIYFARAKDKKRWKIQPIKGDKAFVNVVLKFAASSALKVLVADALGVAADKFKDISLPKKLNPIEAGWAPFATALSSKERGWIASISTKGQKRKGYAWPGVIRHHIDHWQYDVKAQKYGTNDVVYLRDLYRHFGCPPANDTDSVLACMVGAVRWRGYSIDIPKLKELREKVIAQSEAAPKAPKHVLKYLSEVMTPEEQLVFKKDDKITTAKVILETITKLDEDCPACEGEGIRGCVLCQGTGAVKHKAAERARACLDARQSKTKLGNFNKLLQAGRFHVSTNVIGALSGRMSGRDGLNATGIQHEKTIRSIFTLAPPGTTLCGGDFVSYEVAIADARYNDPDLRAQLLTCWHCGHTRKVEEYERVYCPSCHGGQDKCRKCKGAVIVSDTGSILRLCPCGANDITGNPEDTLRKIHGLFAMALFPGKTYEEILATKGSARDLYDYGKRGIFSQLYGGNYNTLMTRLGIPEEDARSAELKFATDYKGVGLARQGIADRFCSMRQPGGIGKAVEWHEPDEYVESLNGFKRYFTLENEICRALFDLANNPPKEWKGLKVECVRRDRVQKIGGAVQSALFAGAFNLQSKNMRAAANHEIQATGAKETKDLQAEIWELQPSGVHDWIVQPMQVHDEIMCPTIPEKVDDLESIVDSFVQRRKSLIPLLRIDWSKSMKNWSEK